MENSSESPSFTLPFPLQDYLSSWAVAQVNMANVVRWNRFTAIPGHAVRSQNNLAHTYGIMQLGRRLIAYIRTHPECLNHRFFNGELFLAAISHHDEGEGHTQRDIARIEKHESHDLEEYYAMVPFWSPEIRQFEEESFLLQFCLQNPQCFPDEARQIMERLARHCRNEALAFQALEYIDYLFYAVEQWQELGNEMIMVQVSRYTVPKLEQVANESRPIRALYWTPHVRTWFREMLESFDGRYTGPQGCPD